MEHGHDSDEIRERIGAAPRQSYLRDWIYGGIDGSITTFAIVAGVVGGDLSSRVVVILGLANLFADGFSMAASNYSGTKAELDERQKLRDMEERHIQMIPEGERAEIREIYRQKGLSGIGLDQAVEATTNDHERWVETMLREEHGQPASIRSPLRAAISTFSAFILCGSAPLMPYLLKMPNSFALSIGLTAMVFFAIGSIKSHWSVRSWWRSGLETLIIGLIAAIIAFAIGWGIRQLAEE